MGFKVVIPARYASTRLPGKPLILLAGKPLVQRVYEQAMRAGADAVLIATDDERIASAARGFSAEVVLTAVTHASGTDRIAEVVRARRWSDASIVVNVQGDEPLIPPAVIQQVAQLLAMQPAADIATLATPIRSLDEFRDPNVVKLVADEQGRALYFSRAPIPFTRDGAVGGEPGSFAGAQRHIGLYAYRAAALLRLAALAPAALEQAERLEQLRALANGMDIRVATACEPPGPDVNTPTDVQRVTALLQSLG